jgi:4-hydroxy-tetrahydrodipicolinate reductase
MEFAGGVEVGDDLGAFLLSARPDALIDFTHPTAALGNALAAVAAGCRPVVGTTGIPPEGIEQLETACRNAGLGGIVAPNFSVGAVLMMHIAEIAAPYFSAADVIELHHQTKADAPSGTALATARRLAARQKFQYARTEKITLAGVRGGEEGGVGIHSVRLPGLVADQEIILGLAGQTLTITHRTTSREAFVPGVLLAVRRVVAEPRFYRALDALLGLG